MAWVQVCSHHGLARSGGLKAFPAHNPHLTMQPAWRFAAIARWEGFVTRHLRASWRHIAARPGAPNR